MLEPLNGKCFITPHLPKQKQAEDVKARSGILLPPPENKLYNFEGVPTSGEIVALPAGYDGPLKVGDVVAFDEASPRGLKYDGRTLFAINLEQIGAIIGP